MTHYHYQCCDCKHYKKWTRGFSWEGLLPDSYCMEHKLLVPYSDKACRKFQPRRK